MKATSSVSRRRNLRLCGMLDTMIVRPFSKLRMCRPVLLCADWCFSGATCFLFCGAALQKDPDSVIECVLKWMFDVVCVCICVCMFLCFVSVCVHVLVYLCASFETDVSLTREL